MIKLDTTTRSLQALLAGAVTTNQLPVTVGYSDGTSATYTGAAQLTLTNSVTPVTICSAPASGVVRDIDYIAVSNTDTAAATVTVRVNDNGTFYEQAKTTLQPGRQLVYTHAAGWNVGPTDATPLPANPTASVGLAAVNGTASTYMRSDAAPALSQSIAPTWTGLHTWNYNTTARPSLPNETGSSIRLQGADSVATLFDVVAYATETGIYARRANGTAAAPTALGSGQNIFAIRAYGYTNGAFQTSRATWAMRSSEAWTSTAQGTDIIFAVTKNGTTTQVNAGSINNDGSLAMINKIFPGTDGAAAQAVCGLYAGTGAPNNANGNNGDIYFNAAGGALTTIYQKRAGAWVGII